MALSDSTSKNTHHPPPTTLRGFAASRETKLAPSPAAAISRHSSRKNTELGLESPSYRRPLTKKRRLFPAVVPRPANCSTPLPQPAFGFLVSKRLLSTSELGRYLQRSRPRKTTRRLFLNSSTRRTARNTPTTPKILRSQIQARFPVTSLSESELLPAMGQ
ncbi:MAG UNVERIFIED_CONTAM: hypothetical protein LVR18_35415 [Planctomycetaceae bacterium]|jgi:hypothetical protein